MAVYFNQLARELARDNIHPLQDFMVRQGRPRPTFQKNPNLANLPCQKIRYAYHYWITRQSETGALPSRDSIRPSGLGIALGNVTLLESIEDGRDYKYRLYGSNIVHLAQQDLQGLKLSEIHKAFPQKKYDDRAFHLAIYQFCQAAATPCYVEYASPSREGKPAWLWRRLTLPLANKQGNPTMLLNCMTAIPLPTAILSDDSNHQSISIA